MIRIKMNSSYFPDWYTDKDFGRESVDKRGYTIYYISAKQLPNYLWRLFQTFADSMCACAISYFKQHPCNIEPKSIKITADNSISHISIKYKIKPTADNIDEVLEQTHADIDEWLADWADNTSKPILCNTIVNICTSEEVHWDICGYNSEFESTQYIKQVLQSVLGMSSLQITEQIMNYEQRDLYSINRADLNEYLMNFDVPELWDMYLDLYLSMRNSKVHPEYYTPSSIVY